MASNTETTDSKLIPLTQGKFAIVDAADYEWLSKYKWCAQKHCNTFYAVRRAREPRSFVQMHRQIMGLVKGDGKQVDHRNGNGLDNRRENIRICTNAQNQQNRRSNINCASIYKGVTADRKRWKAEIKHNNKRHCIGCFATPTEAAHAYDEAAIKYNGEFARLNFPRNGNLLAS